MTTRARATGLALLLAAAAACTSPEATRVRGGGPGADTGNRARAVQMHEGAEPYWQTPRLIETAPASTRTARPPAEPPGGGAPAASPR